MEKLTLTISEVAAMFGVTKKTLRTWDDTGKLKAGRTPGNQRIYFKEDVDKFINSLRPENSTK